MFSSSSSSLFVCNYKMDCNNEIIVIIITITSICMYDMYEIGSIG